MTSRKVVSVGSSSKKSGKSSVASFLVRDLGIDFGLKVGSGSHAETGIITDESVLSRPGTDTGSLLKAGARKVIWVNSPAGELGSDVRQSIEMFPAGGTILIEGNSALDYIDPDFAVFVMTVTYQEFKPSAVGAIGRADIVLVDQSLATGLRGREAVESEIREHAPQARMLWYPAGDLEAVLPRVADAVKRSLWG
jgi:hypothetical protein